MTEITAERPPTSGEEGQTAGVVVHADSEPLALTVNIRVVGKAQ